jgi:hypothetical protein
MPNCESSKKSTDAGYVCRPGSKVWYDEHGFKSVSPVIFFNTFGDDKIPYKNILR